MNSNQPNSGASRTEKQRVAAAAAWMLVLAAVNVAFYWQHWSGRETFPYDFIDGYYTAPAYWIASIEAGEWPHWMPYQSMGFPFAMNVQSGMGYPPLWAFPALKLQYTLHAATVFQLLHVLLGGAGMFFLARAVWRQSWPAGPAAVAFMLCGGFFSNAEEPDIIRAFGMLPWLFWAVWLDDAPGREFVFLHRRWTTRLPLRALALPPLVALFISGAYAGNMIAGLLMLGVFLVVQTARLLLRGTPRTALNDAAAQATLIGLGVALAAAFLVPLLGLYAEFVRSGDLANIERWRLGATAPLYLLYPCSVGYSGRSAAEADWSMLGMQLPVVIFPFLLLARWKDLWRLAPFFAAAAAAAVLLSFEYFAPLARQAWRICPPLELSRFPAGDYRMFIYLAALMACGCGVRRLLELRGPMPTGLFARLAIGAALPVLGALLLMRFRVCADDQSRLIEVLCWQSAGLIALMFAVWLSPGGRRAAMLGPALVLLSAFTLWPIAADMARFWRVPLDVVENYYAANGVPLGEGGWLSVAGIFSRGDAGPRPPRQSTSSPQDFAWQGYVNGKHMTDDRTGGIARRRQIVADDPMLTDYMRRGSELRALEIDPAAVKDDLPLPPPADAAGPLRAWSVERFGRNEVVYQLTLSRPAVVVENEMWFPGWRGFLNEGTESIRPLLVAGALRGWEMPAGVHRLSLRYRTPRLVPGAAVSAAALLVYAAAVVSLIVQARNSAAFRSTQCRQNMALPPAD